MRTQLFANIDPGRENLFGVMVHKQETLPFVAMSSFHAIVAAFFVLATTITTTRAFYPVAPPIRVWHPLMASSATKNAIARIHDEYHELKEQLGLYHGHDNNNNNNNKNDNNNGDDNDAEDTDKFTELVLEKAAELTVQQRHEQEQLLEDAHRELHRAQQLDHYNTARAHDSLEAHKEAELRAEQPQAAHQQQLHKSSSSSSSMEEETAEEKQTRAATFLKKLLEMEQELSVALEELRHGTALEEWTENEAPKHQEFLQTVRSHLIDHDPTRGDVAF